MKVHLVAICGTGMGALAGLLKEAGHEVTGSDRAFYPPMSERLQAWGIVEAAGEGTAAVLVGDNPASKIYIRNKVKACAEAGVHSEVHGRRDAPREGGAVTSSPTGRGGGAVRGEGAG